tara:strand:- start:1094 stop:1561 length:468 start_codon:yes stop_codon:yes gene_type:complete
MHRFILNEEQKKIGEDLRVSIQKVSLPEKIISLRYNLLINPEVSENEIILGYTKNETSKNYLFIDTNDKSVNHKWNYNQSECYFINSSIELLEKSLNILDFYLDDLIENKELGEYHVHHKRYANVLERLLSKIDIKSVTNGFWYSFIEEMKMGVI